MATSEIVLESHPAVTWRHYYQLTKPKVIGLILFSALVGMLLAAPNLVPWPTLVFGLLGIGLGSAAGAALNQVLDQRIDTLMERTRDRPLPSGQLNTRRALAFAVALAALSMLILGTLVNGLTALLTFCALIGYAGIYTLVLKRRTPQNIVWGGLAGAAPPLLGWTAVAGEIHLHALLLVLLIFVWTPPHFWALAIKRRDEYARAGIPMLPVTHGIGFTKRQILVYTLLLVVVSLLPYSAQMSGILYLIGALILGAGFVYRALRLLISTDEGQAMRTFSYSIVYLTLLFSSLLVDHYLADAITIF